MDEHALWQRYTAAPVDQRAPHLDALTEHYMPLAERIARHRHRQLPPTIDFDDIYSAAYCGLFNAIPRFDPSRGLRPSTFLTHRIRGSIADWQRSNDDMSRTRRARQVRIDHWTQMHCDHAPTEDEIFAEFGFRIGSPRTISMETPIPGRWDHHQTVADSLPARKAPVERSGLCELSDMLRSCDKRERLVLLMYHIDGMKMSDIAESLGVSESRISQMHKQILRRLRTTLTNAD